MILYNSGVGKMSQRISDSKIKNSGDDLVEYTAKNRDRIVTGMLAG